MNADSAENWQDFERQAVSLVDSGHRFQRLGQDEEALASFDKAVTICRGMSDTSDPVALALAQALDNKGNALVDLERLAEAIPCFDEAIRIHEGFVRGDGNWQDVREIAVTVMNKARAFMLQGRHAEARAGFEQAIDTFERCKSDEDLARAWLGSGDLYVREDRFPEALAALDESLRYSKAVTEDDPDAAMGDTAYALSSKADVLLCLGRYHEALQSSDHSIAIHRAIMKQTNTPEERETMAEAVNLRGHILTKLGRTDDAQECFREAAQLTGKEDGTGRDVH